MIAITPSIWLNEDELKFDFLRAPGPGGQNVNKVSSAVQLRLDVRGSPSIPEGVKQRLIRLAGRRITSEGILIIEANQYRSQERNREAAMERLTQLIVQASLEPRPRQKTRPSRTATLRRLETKRRRGIIKRMRQPGELDG
ncbi:MAG: aminoacyl-tRNA hydrolase [Anaerolineales bacterium]|nr:aminoacyl-tRNA hydrolase [Anaerolineae bacterium]PWB49515.1 MAG: aminoacyl-tRNA hydrolase [Anaerolineales bacterium]